MKTIFQILGFSLVHVFLVATIFTFGVVVQGGFLRDVDISETARVVSAMCGGIVQLLEFPAFFALSIIPKPVPDLLEWGIVALNSLLFGAVVVIVIKASKAVKRKP